jgi:N-acyl-D-aspartate/D-glutamate deacylase
LVEDDGRAFIYQPVSYGGGNLDRVRDMLVHPNTIPGLADGGAHAGSICDASFATYLLTHWGRDRPSGRLPVEWLVEQQCRATARHVGLLDRGVLAPGFRADLNVIDFDRLCLRVPEMRADLPAGGRRLLQRADGYRHTFVAGVETYRDGESTGARPGRLIRGAQPAPT